MQVIALSVTFYEKYKDCRELMRKPSRPYVCLFVTLGGMSYAIPFRHHIHHKYCFHTIGDAGIDFSKCVPILSEKFISSNEPDVDRREWTVIKGHQKQIVYEFRNYLNAYKKARRNPEVPRNRDILVYSSLQYFDELFRD